MARTNLAMVYLFNKKFKEAGNIWCKNSIKNEVD